MISNQTKPHNKIEATPKKKKKKKKKNPYYKKSSPTTNGPLCGDSKE
jgi:hypothetical protein